MSYTPRAYQDIRDSILDDIVSRGLITDRNVGGVARTLVEAYSRELATLHESLKRVYDSAFIDTAEGKSLDFVVSILGIERIKAEQALGTVVFSRRTPAEGDITIHEGTIITRPRSGSGDRPPLFETTEERTLEKGKTEVEVPIRSQEMGQDGVVGPKELSVLPRPLVGIETVTNIEGTALRLRDESDDELRQRARDALKNTGKATEDALAFSIRKLGAESVEIVDMPSGMPGEIEVIVDGKALDNPDMQRDIQEVINDTKAAGIKATLCVTTRVAIELKLRLSLKEPVEVAEEIKGITDEVDSRVKEYISSLQVGGIVRRNGIISAVLGHPAIQEVEFLPVDKDLSFWISVINNEEPRKEIEEDVRKRMLDGGDIFIGKQERAVISDKAPLDISVKEQKFNVFVDIYNDGLLLEADTNVTEEQLTELIRDSISKALHKFAESMKDAETGQPLRYENIIGALVEGGTIKVSDGQLGTKVVLLHSLDGLESTLEVNGQRDIIRANEVPVLRSLNIRLRTPDKGS